MLESKVAWSWAGNHGAVSLCVQWPWSCHVHKHCWLFSPLTLKTFLPLFARCSIYGWTLHWLWPAVSFCVLCLSIVLVVNSTLFTLDISLSILLLNVLLLSTLKSILSFCVWHESTLPVPYLFHAHVEWHHKGRRTFGMFKWGLCWSYTWGRSEEHQCGPQCIDLDLTHPIATPTHGRTRKITWLIFPIAPMMQFYLLSQRYPHPVFWPQGLFVLPYLSIFLNFI